jgi:hypothetical protein
MFFENDYDWFLPSSKRMIRRSQARDRTQSATSELSGQNQIGQSKLDNPKYKKHESWSFLKN